MVSKRNEKLLTLSLESKIEYLDDFIDSLSDEEFKEHLQGCGFEIIEDVGGKLFTDLFTISSKPFNKQSFTITVNSKEPDCEFNFEALGVA